LLPLPRPSLLSDTLFVLQAPSAKRFQLSGLGSASAPTLSPISFTISQLNQYYFVFLNCQSQYPVSYSGTLSFVNANGQQLAYDQIPLVPLHVGLLSVYMVVLLWWVLLPRIALGGRNNPFLTNICVAILCIRTVYIGLELFEIHQLSDVGMVSMWSHIVSQIFDTISSALVNCVMLLISLGWRITRYDLNPRERQFFSGGFSLYAIFDFMRRFCTEGLCTAYLLSFYVVKFLILFCILVAINSNIGTLILALCCNSSYKPFREIAQRLIRWPSRQCICAVRMCLFCGHHL